MNFYHPSYLWFLAVIPPALILFFWWSWRARQKLAAQFIQTRLLPGLLAGVSPSRQKFRAACLVAAAVCLILALARPQWGYDLEEVHQRGLDIVMAIDTSKSMLATDVAPNRLARAKLAALDLMQQAKSDRLGLVAFAGGAFLQCPLTIDDSAFRQSVEALDVNTLPEGGTALGDAIETAFKAFKEEDSFKVLVLFTDGEDHDSGALDAAKKAAAAGMQIYTIGIGSAEGEILRIQGRDGQADYIRDEHGNVVKSHLNEQLLKDIAVAANGYYLPLRGANTMDMLYQKCLEPLPKSTSREQWVKRPRERYHWPLALAILLLTVEMFLPERKRDLKKAAAEPARSALATAAMLALLLLPADAFGSSSSSALREYRSGNFDQSLKEYEQLLGRKRDDPRLQFNAGAAAYRSERFDQATNYFGRALTSPDLNLQEQAYYNLGNTLFHLGDRDSDPTRKMRSWEQSLTNYSNSLKLDPQDTDAKFNYELVKRKLEELKQQQQQQQKQQQNSDQNKSQQDQKQDKQQPDQSKNDQQQDQKQDSNQNQKQSEQNQQQANQSQDKKNQEKKDQEKKDQEKNVDQPKGSRQTDQDSNEQAEAASYAAGQMTPQQARQLLDSQKSAEMLLPAKPDQKASGRTGPTKDW